MDSIHNLPRKSSFVSDMLKLVGGTAFAQGILVIIAPILTRYYGPDDLGLAALFISMVGIISAVSCLRYDMAIMLPKNDDDAVNLLALCICISIGLSALILPVLWVGEWQISLLLNTPNLSPYLWLISPAILMGGFFLALNHYNSRTKQFARLSIARVFSSIATATIQLLAGFLGYASGIALIYAYIIGSTASAFMLSLLIWKDDNLKFKRDICVDSIFKVSKRYRNFPIFDTWGAILNVASWQIPVVLLSMYFSPAVVGSYALGKMVLQLPASLVGGAISQVFFQRASRANYEGKLKEITSEILIRLIIISIFPTLLLLTIGKDIFLVIFGSNWVDAGIYAQIMSLWIFFVFITSPISSLFSILEKQVNLLFFNIILFLTRAGAIITGGIYNDALMAITLFSIVGIIDYAAMELWILKKIGIRQRSILYKCKYFIIYSLSLVIALNLCQYILKLGPTLVVVLGGLMAILYFVVVLSKDSALKLFLCSIIQRFDNSSRISR